MYFKGNTFQLSVHSRGHFKFWGVPLSVRAFDGLLDVHIRLDANLFLAIYPLPFPFEG